MHESIANIKGPTPTFFQMTKDPIPAVSSIIEIALSAHVQELSHSLQEVRKRLQQEKEGRLIAEHRAKHMYRQVMYISTHPNQRRVQPSIAIYPTSVPPMELPEHAPAHARESVCGICFEALDAIGWYTLACGHPFHLYCISRSLVSKCKCPVCRYQVDEAAYVALGMDDLYPGPNRMVDVDTGIPIDFTQLPQQEEAQLPRRQWYELEQLEPLERSRMDCVIPSLMNSSSKCNMSLDHEQREAYELENESRSAWIKEQEEAWQQLVEFHRQGLEHASVGPSQIDSSARVVDYAGAGPSTPPHAPP